MQHNRRFVAGLLVLLVFGSFASVDGVDKRPKFTCAIEIGLSDPTGSMANSNSIYNPQYHNGIGLGIAVGTYWPKLPFDLRGEIGYDRIGMMRGVFDWDPPWKGYARVYGFSPQVVIRPPVVLPVVPYLIIGAGPYKVETYYHYNQPILDLEFEQSYNAVKLGVIIGVGIKFLRKDGYGLLLEWRYMALSPVAYLNRWSVGYAIN